MKVVIVAKTRMGRGACIGGITFDSRLVRLIPADKEFNEQFNQKYEIGDVWDVSHSEDKFIVPPHVENIIVHKKTKLPPINDLTAFIEHHMPLLCGGVELLFGGLAQATSFGAQYIAERTGIPSYSTFFWRPDKPLDCCDDAKRIRYRYPLENGVRTLTFVGYQEPIDVIPAGSLIRVSLAHWWQPSDKPDYESRCYVQLSGWFNEEIKIFTQILRPDRSTVAKSYNNPDIENTQRILEQVFGHDTFRPFQKEIITNVLKKKDTLAVMPTGSGKSICYQLPALIFPGLTFVVSPLISLMQDQVEQSRQNGINAEFLNSTLPYHEYIRITNRIRTGEVKLLYAAPETLLKPETLLLLEQIEVDCLTIDEAHCISQWGHDFRPEYRQLITLLDHLPQATCLAVTATATMRVRNDIKQTLNISEADEFVASFNRKNLFLAVDQKTGSINQILDFLEDHKKEAGIIYCNTKREVNRLVKELAARSWPVLPYHADLDNKTREQNHRRFIFEEDLIMIATIAFGMGIDKSNVRFILHSGLPKNLEIYYQQIGRAGRDGLRADCLLLYNERDIGTIRYFIEQQDESQQAGAWARLRTMLAFTETTRCRRLPLLAYFGEDFKAGKCEYCDNCLELNNEGEEDLTIPAQKFLSCVIRTRQYFGREHIIKILRGSRAKSVLTNNHDQLSTYNIGREYSIKQWRDLADQFLGLGLLQKDIRYGSVRVTEKGQEVLKGSTVVGHIPQEESIKSHRLPHNYKEEYNPKLFERLRSKRSELAQQASVPPYLIFSDFSLSEMAYYFPQNVESFGRISGVGNLKLEKYAGDFLPIIIAFCQEHHIPEKSNLIRSRRLKKRNTTNSPKTTAVGESFNSGDSLQDIADDFSIKERTVISHLWKYFQSGETLNRAHLLAQSRLDEDDRHKILEVLPEIGLDRLKPIFDHFDGCFSYEELRIMCMYYQLSVIE